MRNDDARGVLETGARRVSSFSKGWMAREIVRATIVVKRLSRETRRVASRVFAIYASFEIAREALPVYLSRARPCACGIIQRTLTK